MLILLYIKQGIYEFTVIVIYMILIALVNTFKTIRHGSFTRKDIINSKAYVWYYVLIYIC